jgi:predicted Zn-dependent peptidase
MYQKSVLDNGLRVLTVPMPHTRSVTVLLSLGVGSRYERQCESGASHYLEHMAFKGTTRRPTPRAISEAIEGIGGLMNASTSVESTGYWVKVAQDHFPVAADVLADMLRDPLFEPKEIEKERRVILEELKMIYDVPSHWVQVLFNREMWPDHPVGRDVGGSPETIAAMSRDDLLSYRVEFYHPQNLVVAVAGKIDHDHVVSEITEALGNWGTKDASAPCRPADQPGGEPSLIVETRPTEQANLCLGVRALPRKHEDRFKLRVLNTVLGEGMSSRLFQEIREKRGLAYGVYSSVHSLSDTGSLAVSAGVAPQNTPLAVSAILEEMVRFRDQPISADELFRAKEFIKGRMLLAMEDTFTNASWVGRQEILDDEILDLDEVISQIDAVQATDVQDVAGRLFQAESLVLAAVGPNETEGLRDRLVF